MIKTIRIDDYDNYLIDRSTNKRCYYFDPNNENQNLVIKLDNSILEIDHDKINVKYGNQIVVNYNNDIFIIDDGYQSTLVKAGYLVYKNYDENIISSKEEGLEVFTKIQKEISKSIKRHFDNEYVITFNAINLNMNFKDEDKTILEHVHFEFYPYYFDLYLNDIPGIVGKNQIRKDNSLPFYPFDKKMDKYGTMYLSIFAGVDHEVRLNKVIYQDRFNISNNEIKYIISDLGNDYHFVSQMIKRRLVLADGL